MRNRDFKLVLGSTILASDGINVRGDALVNRTIMALSIRKGTYMGRPEFGSLLHLIKKLTEDELFAAENYARQALLFLVKDGSVISFDVIAILDEAQSRLVLKITHKTRRGNVAVPDFYVKI